MNRNKVVNFLYDIQLFKVPDIDYIGIEDIAVDERFGLWEQLGYSEEEAKRICLFLVEYRRSKYIIWFDIRREYFVYGDALLIVKTGTVLKDGEMVDYLLNIIHQRADNLDQSNDIKKLLKNISIKECSDQYRPIIDQEIKERIAPGTRFWANVRYANWNIHWEVTS